jgi:hypothetical protein
MNASQSHCDSCKNPDDLDNLLTTGKGSKMIAEGFVKIALESQGIGHICPTCYRIRQEKLVSKPFSIFSFLGLDSKP